jgi:hypothetical protein
LIPKLAGKCNCLRDDYKRVPDLSPELEYLDRVALIGDVAITVGSIKT